MDVQVEPEYARVGVALQPVVDRLTWYLLQGNTLHADETPVAQLDPGNGKTRKAYLWAYRSNDLAGEGPRMIAPCVRILVASNL